MFSDYVDFSAITMPSEFSLNNLIYSDAMGYTDSENFLIERESFDDHLLLYVISGIFRVEQYSKKLTLTSGDGLLMTLKDKHKYYSDTKQGCKFIWLHFNGNQSDFLMDTAKNTFSLPLSTNLHSMETDICRCFDTVKRGDIFKNNFEFEISTIIYKLLLDIIKNEKYKFENKYASEKEIFMRSIDQYINLNLS